jgi:aminopeptidase-like protein
MEKVLRFDPYLLLQKLFPIHRTIAGKGIQQTLEILKTEVPQLKIVSSKSNKRIWDWKTPSEWHLNYAYILDENGRKIIDSSDSNLRVVGHSVAVNKTISHEDLMSHLHYRPDFPTAIPYVTSYYSETWGFCIKAEELTKFNSKNYQVVIDSEFTKGNLRYGEIIIKGKNKEEILFSTNICHPSLANNELSGPVVLIGLAKRLLAHGDLEFTYRLVFVPETIGSIVFLKQNLKHLKRFCKAGLVATCLGDSGNFSYIPSRKGDTLSDRAALHLLSKRKFNKYSWADRGSDERQYCYPSINLPIASITRSKYREYEEYHTSLDDLSFVSKKYLDESIEIYYEFCRIIEMNKVYKVNTRGEPHLSKYGLYETLSKVGSTSSGVCFLDLLNFADGKHDLLQISEALNRNLEEVAKKFEILLSKKLVKLK